MSNRTLTLRVKTKRLPKPPPPTDNDDWAPSVATLADAVGKAPHTLHTYHSVHGAPLQRTKRGYSISAMRNWMEEHGYTPGARLGPPESTPGNRPQARDRLLSAQAEERETRAELARLQLAAARGEFMPKTDVQERDRARIQVVKRGLFGLVKSLPPRLLGLKPAEMEVVIKEHVRELLTRFAQM